ncbi:MAG: IniB N-terminal domain-containing protein [Mycobacterium sp.]
MATLVDYMLGLYRSPEAAQAFIEAPAQALNDAGFPNVTPAQLQAVAASAVPPDLALGEGDLVANLQPAVADHHGITLDEVFGEAPAEGPSAEDGFYGRYLPGEQGPDGKPADDWFLDRYQPADPAPGGPGPASTEGADDRYSVDYDPIVLNETPGSTAPEGMDDAPADSLLLPYFEVDLDEPDSPASLFPPDGG